jgi:hypothetical protein
LGSAVIANRRRRGRRNRRHWNEWHRGHWYVATPACYQRMPVRTQVEIFASCATANHAGRAIVG